MLNVRKKLCVLLIGSSTCFAAAACAPVREQDFHLGLTESAAGLAVHQADETAMYAHEMERQNVALQSKIESLSAAHSDSAVQLSRITKMAKKYRVKIPPEGKPLPVIPPTKPKNSSAKMVKAAKRTKASH